MSGQKPLLLIAAGGTGGHMFPAQALAEHMLRQGWRVVLSTDARGARYTGGFPHMVDVQEVTSATFARGGALAKLVVPFRIFKGVMSAVGALRRDRPDVVVGFGGYPTIPALAAAWLLRLPRLIHEQNGVLGRVNTVFAKRVHKVACGTWPTALPKGADGIHTGNPVRRVVAEKAGAPYTPPGDHPVQIVVIGGSQGARILSDNVPEAIAHLPHHLRDRIRVIQQARAEDGDRVAEFYEANRIPHEVAGFVDVPKAFASAQLVIARAGASTVADIAMIGRPAILVPIASAIGDHQTANARTLVDAGAAIMIPESRLTPAVLSEHIATVLDDPEGAARMAAGAQTVAVRDATERLAELVNQLAGRTDI